MPMKTTLTARIAPTTRFLPVVALWALLGRVRLVDSLDSDSSELGFVLDHPSKLAISPLVKALVHSLSVAHPITDAANIADRDRRDTSLKEHLHDLSAQFVKEIRDLVVDVIQLFLLRLDEFLPAVRSTLFAVDLCVKFGLETVLVVAESTKLPAVNCEGVIASEDSGEVFLAEINPGHFVSGGAINGLSVVLSTDNESVRGLSDLDGPRFFVDGPVNQNRIFSTLCGQAKHAVVSKRDSLVGPTENIVLFITAFWRITFPVIVVPGTNRFVELLRDFLGRLRRQHVVTLAVPPPHSRLTGPVILTVYRSPVPLADRVPQVRRRLGQPFKLFGAFNMEFAGQVHASGLVFDVLLNDLLAHFPGRAYKVRTGPEGRKSMQVVELVSEDVSAGSFESVNHLIRSVTSIRLNEEVDMIGPNCQEANLPVMLFGYFMKHFLQAVRYFTLEHTRSPFRTPYEVILHRVDGVTASAIWFFVDWHHSINRLSCPVFRERSLTSRSTSHCACPDYCRGKSPCIPTAVGMNPEGFSKSTPPGQLLLRASSIL
jgi:hypothetical protein